MREVGVEELHEDLGHVLAEVEAGESVVVISHGHAIARIEPVPLGPDMPEQVRLLVESGHVIWNGRPLEDVEPIDIGPGPAVSDILLEQRGPRIPMSSDELS